MSDNAPNAWKLEAACREIADNTFFPDPSSKEGNLAALAICHRCPVTQECLRYALQLGIRHGVWGATTEAQRAGMDELRQRPHNVKESWQVDHGTLAGARWHHRHGERPCDACARTERERKAEVMRVLYHGRKNAATAIQA